MLARALESANIPTVLITPMPFWAEKIGVPRTLAVEHPFGRTLAQPHDTTTQTHVLHAALNLFATATEAGIIEHAATTWDEPVKTTIAAWQPKEPSPIIGMMAPILRERMRKKK